MLPVAAARLWRWRGGAECMRPGDSIPLQLTPGMKCRSRQGRLMCMPASEVHVHAVEVVGAACLMGAPMCYCERTVLQTWCPPGAQQTPVSIWRSADPSPAPPELFVSPESLSCEARSRFVHVANVWCIMRHLKMNRVVRMLEGGQSLIFTRQQSRPSEA
jgi:hypothetical protein